MRVLLDESLPRELAQLLVGHDAKTVGEQRWSGRSNGDLLRAAVGAGFQVLLTPDRNLEYQQNIPAFALCVMVLHAPSNRLDDLSPLVPRILAAFEGVQLGTIIHVGV